MRDIDVVVRDRIVAAFGPAVRARVMRERMSPADTRRVVHDRVDRRLLTDASRTVGQLYRFAATGEVRVIGVLALSFPSTAIAQQRARPLRGMRYLSGTVILTPMRITASVNRVFVIFTESAGDARVLTVMNDTAELVS